MSPSVERSERHPLPAPVTTKALEAPVVANLSTPLATEGRRELLGMGLAEMEELLVTLGHRAFHGRQLFQWVYKKRERDFSRMTDLSAELREALTKTCSMARLNLIELSQSTDGTEKSLFAIPGAEVETVLIPDERTTTACVSSQAGCPLACQFCATGTMDLKRNLTVGEIVGQLLALRDRAGDHAFSNIVFMGMGEPLLNYEAVMAAVEIITSPFGLGVSPRRVTISTSGVTPKITKLAREKVAVNLAISLHAATQLKRERIMPVARTFSLEKLLAAARDFATTTGRRVTFEYILFDNFNDGQSDINALVSICHTLNCKINILAYNPVPGLDFARPDDRKVNWFARELSERGVIVTVRTSRGRDIDAACGQLAARRHAERATALST